MNNMRALLSIGRRRARVLSALPTVETSTLQLRSIYCYSEISFGSFPSNISRPYTTTPVTFMHDNRPFEHDFSVGTKHRGVVAGITDFGAFVRLDNCDDNKDALLHITEIADRYVVDPWDEFTEGQEIQVVVLPSKYPGAGLRVSSKESRLKQEDFDPGSYYSEGTLSEGTEHWAVVQEIKDFGAFVQIEHHEDAALLPVEEIADHYVVHPSEHLTEGQKIQVVVLPWDRGGLRVSSKRSRFKETMPSDFSEGTEHWAVVQKIIDFGAFVRLENCMHDALLRIAEISDDYLEHPSDGLTTGQRIKVVILSSDDSGIKVSSRPSRLKGEDGFDPAASMSVTSKNKNTFDADDDDDDGDWKEDRSIDVSEETEHWAVVQRIKDFGAFVRIEHCEDDALLRIGDIADHFVEHPSDDLTEGQKIRVIVLSNDDDGFRVSSKPSRFKRELEDDFEPVTSRSFTSKNKNTFDGDDDDDDGEHIDVSEGTKHWALVRKFTDYGAFVRLDNCMQDALLHVREIAEHYVEHPSDDLAEGQKIEVVVLSNDARGIRVSSKPSRLKQELEDDSDPVASRSSKNEENITLEVGTMHWAVVQQIKDFGAFVRIEDCDYDALLSIGEIANHYVEHPSDDLTEGQRIQVIVLGRESNGLRVSSKPSRIKYQLEDEDEDEDEFDPETES